MGMKKIVLKILTADDFNSGRILHNIEVFGKIRRIKIEIFGIFSV